MEPEGGDAYLQYKNRTEEKETVGQNSVKETPVGENEIDQMQTVSYYDGGTLFDATYHIKEGKVSIICTFFDLKDNRVHKYNLQIEKVPENLDIVYESVQELFKDAIKGKEYEVQKGRLILPYSITKKNKEVVTKKYEIPMNQIELGREEQLEAIIEFLKGEYTRRHGTQLQNKDKELSNKDQQLQDAEQRYQKLLFQFKKDSQEKQRQIAELRDTYFDQSGCIASEEDSVDDMAKRVKKVKQKDELKRYCRSIINQHPNNSQLIRAIYEICIKSNIILCSNCLTKDSGQSNRFYTKNLRIQNSYFKKYTKTDISIQALNTYQKFQITVFQNGQSLIRYYFHCSKKSSTCSIRIDRQSNNVQIYREGLKKSAKILSPYEIEQQIVKPRIEFEVKFDNQTDLKVDIERI